MGTPAGVRSQSRCATLALGAALIAAIPGARANENDALYKAFEDFCLASHASVEAAERLVLKPELDPRGISVERGPPYEFQVGLVKLGAGATLVTFKGPARKKPPSQCMFTSYSDDALQIVTRVRATFSLPEPTKNSIGHNQFEIYGWTTLRNRPIIMQISYGLQDNAPAGGFTLTVSDSSTDDTERLVKAIQQLCLTPRRTADEAAKAALKTPHAVKDIGLRKSPGHERMIRLGLGKGSSFAIFKAASPRAQLDECQINATITDMPRLMGRLRETLGFSAPIPGEQLPDSQATSWRSSAKVAVGSETRTADLTYLLNENKHSGVFTLTVTR
jgi:hypothetical protein